MAIKYVSRLHQQLIANGVAVVSVNSDGIVAPASLQASANPIIAGFDDSDAAQNTYLNNLARAQGSDNIDNSRSTEDKKIRAALIVAVDEINLLRQWLVSFKAEVAAATTLADLKTRVATLPNMPDRTTAQAYAAIKNKIVTGQVD